MEIYFKGLDLTEKEFDSVNNRISKEIGQNFASKICATDKGYWMQIVESYIHYFTKEELENAVVYTPSEKLIIPERFK